MCACSMGSAVNLLGELLLLWVLCNQLQAVVGGKGECEMIECG